MLREGHEHGVGAASPRRGISTLSALGFVLVDALGFVLVDALGFVLVDALDFVLVDALGFVLVEVLFGLVGHWWPHCRQKRGTFLS